MNLLAINLASLLAALWAVGMSAIAAETPPATAAGIEHFERRVWPLLVERCQKCHGEKKQEAGLRLDSRAAALKGSDDGAVIVPGDAAGSKLLRAISYEDEPKMPPKAKLPPEAIEALTEWIKQGAPWPDDPSSQSAAALAETQRAHWAFQPVKLPPLPQVQNVDWAQSPLDRFVLAKLEHEGVAPGKPADRRTLIRRASFDLLGLPPSYGEIEALAADTSPAAFARLVDRLLSSPLYGERWGRYWLDVARYADTKGYVFTQDRKYPKAYAYRDWVIGSLNGDLPYDQFLVYQVAADQLVQGDDKSPLAAMGFLTLGQRFLNNPNDIIDDRLDVLCRGTMGLTVACARCHDHKFDPIPTADYYSLHGVFASSVESNEPSGMMTLADGSSPHNSHVFLRGNPGNRGPEVPRQFLGVLAGPERKPFERGSGRLELARAIASRDNPLTARVIVNRVWLQHFGAGLVRTPSDFGMRSDPPSHPELLDYLAWRFVEEGWSLKNLHRTIMLSSTYQQACRDDEALRRRDPLNQWLWTANRRRLDFEALRDALLAASGSLDSTLGGPSINISRPPFGRRRSVYALIDRQNLPGLLRTFDFASPDTHSPQRYVTTSPQQALFLMNSAFVLDRARELSQRLSAPGTADAGERIARLYQSALGRQPSVLEAQLGQEFLAAESSQPPGGEEAAAKAWTKYAQVLLMSNEFGFVD